MLLAIAAYASCTVYREVPIEIRRMEEISLPVATDTVLFLYRNFKYPKDTLIHYYKADKQLFKDRENENRNIDSLIVSACLEKVAEKFSEKEIGRHSLVLSPDLMPRQTAEHLSPLPAALVTRIAEASHASVIIALETFSCFYTRYSNDGMNPASREVAIAGIWTVYDGMTGKASDRKTMTDTLYWEAENGIRADYNAILPPRLPALILAAEAFGEQYAERFFSDWISVQRIMVIPPLEEFRIAALHAEEQDWETAGEIWKKYTPDRFGRLAVGARYNLALAMEIGDKHNEALDWIGQAYHLAKVYNNPQELQMVNTYRQILQKRLNEIENLRRGEDQNP